MPPRDPTLVRLLIQQLLQRKLSHRALGKTMSAAVMFEYLLKQLIAELPKSEEPIYPIYRNSVHATVY